jgi:predicted transcriptional regulator
MTTTIQINEAIRDRLNELKIHNRETYNDVLKRLLEDFEELKQKTKRELRKAIEEIESGSYKTLDEMISELGL